MKPIIVEMNDMSESVEVYGSKPNPFLTYTIYVIFGLLVAACIWMYFFKIDDVVKSDSMFKSTDEIFDVCSAVTGEVEEKIANSGDYVKAGDTLYIVNIESLSDTIISYQKELKDAEDRLVILEAYAQSLSGDEEILERLSDNQYYDEFINRRALLMANIEAEKENSSDKTELYNDNVKLISETIEKYNKKIDKLNEVKSCISSKNNTFDSSESYYYSIVSSYISSYDYNKLQYDNKIKDYQSQIDKLDDQLKATEDSTDAETVKKSKDEISQMIESAKAEQIQALTSLERQQISTIEQSIESLNDTLLTLNSNLESAKSEQRNFSYDGGESSKNIAVLTEKGNISNEKLTYEEKKEKCENYLKNYNIQNENCSIKALASGYYYESQQLKHGSYMQEGATLGRIYPEKESEFYAEVYVENSDIGKIEEGQRVNLDISAYPSSEYGYVKGKVANISKDIMVDENSGKAYYLVKVQCDNMSLKSKNGDVGYLKNGMACQAKILIGEKSVMNYLLEKINILD